jgi:tetratricopeptide (TPR) repeat protein/predicted O-methyltransferase YrrM
MHILTRLLQAYKRHGFSVHGGLNPYYFDDPDAPFMKLYRDGAPISTGAGLAPIEIMILEQILLSLSDVKRILIIGNAFGWSTLAIAMSCPNARVIAVDADLEGNDAGFGRKLTEDIAEEEGLNVHVVQALSPRDVASVVLDHLNGEDVDFVLIDGLHVSAQLLRDFDAISQHASLNCIFVMHDVLSWHMLSAVNEISERYLYTTRILTRSPSGMAIAYKNISPLMIEIIESYVDETIDPLVWIESQGGNLRDAGLQLQSRLSKGYPFRLIGLAGVSVAEGNWEQATEILNQAIRADPYNAKVAFEAGAFLLDQKKWLEAEQLFLKAVQLLPEWAEPHHQLGRVSRQLKRFEEALLYFEQAAKLDPTSFPPHAEMGFVEIERGNLESAIHHFKHAISLDQYELFLWFELLQLYISLGHYYCAFNCLQVVQKQAPAEILPWESLVAILPSGNDRGAAVLALEMLCKREPNWKGARKTLGIMLRKVGRLIDSRHVFEEGVAYFSEWPGAGVLYELGITCKEMGDDKAAKTYLERASLLRSKSV